MILPMQGVVDGLFSYSYVTLSRIFFFLPAVLLSIFTLLCFPSSSVSVSYFNLNVPMRKCSREHSCMSSTFLIAILNSICVLFSLSWDWLCFSLGVLLNQIKYNIKLISAHQVHPSYHLVLFTLYNMDFSMVDFNK